jgi:hypothetical protein
MMLPGLDFDFAVYFLLIKLSNATENVDQILEKSRLGAGDR